MVRRSQQTPSFMELEEIYDATVPQSCSSSADNRNRPFACTHTQLDKLHRLYMH